MKLKKYILIIVPVILIILFLVFKSGIFNVNIINVELNNVSCLTEQDIRSELSLKGKNILLVSNDEINKKIINKYPCVKQVVAKKLFPKQIKLIVTGRNAIFRISSYHLSLDDLEASPSSSAALLNWSYPSSLSQVFLIDDEGIIFKEGGDVDLPVLFLEDQNFKVGFKFDVNLINKISSLFNGLRRLNILFSESKIVNNFLQIKATPKLTFSMSRDILGQLASLQLILQKAKIDGKEVDSIDLRFDKPVVIYFSKK